LITLDVVADLHAQTHDQGYRTSELTRKLVQVYVSTTPDRVDSRVNSFFE